MHGDVILLHQGATAAMKGNFINMIVLGEHLGDDGVIDKINGIGDNQIEMRHQGPNHRHLDDDDDDLYDNGDEDDDDDGSGN